jgi:hypothetical protein
MTDVKHVKAAIGQDDLLTGATPLLDARPKRRPIYDLIPTRHLR